MTDAPDPLDETAFGRLLDPRTGEPLADVEASWWVIPPDGDMPGKWGGTFRIIPPPSPRLKPLDFQFVLALEDGRRADIFSELDLEALTGTIDGNGPPPT